MANDGGLAFPFVSHGGYHEHQHVEPGMTLRDYFAAQAMVALLQRTDTDLIYRVGSDGPPQWNGFALDKYGERRASASAVLSRMAYEAADAMLAAKALLK